MMVWYCLLIFAVAFLVTYLMVPVSKRLAQVMGAIDYPDNRRVNFKPMPRCGGIALYAGFLAGVSVLFLGVKFFGWEITDLYLIRGVNYYLLFFGITAMFCVGLVDDITQLPALVKFAGQIGASLIIASSGVTIGLVRNPLDSAYFSLGVFDIPLTVLYLLVFVNITNLIDGLDGLASGIVAIVSTALLYLCFMRGSFTLVFACVALIACCLAFLRFNFYPAQIFMGDSGALLLGAVVGCISIIGVVRIQSFAVMMVPLVIAGVPLIDTCSAIVRRKRSHVSVGQADMGHLHHRLLKAGFGQRRSVAVLWICSAVMAFGGCIIGLFSGPVRYFALAVLTVAVVYTIWHFGLFKPVLRHYYKNRGNIGPRRPPKK